MLLTTLSLPRQQDYRMRSLENVTYDEISVGDFASFTKTLNEQELIMYASAVHDVNPAEMTLDRALDLTKDDKIGFGKWASSLITTTIANVIPGPGSIHLEQTLDFDTSVDFGETLTVKLTVVDKLDHNRVKISCELHNQDGAAVAKGDAKVVAPSEKVSLDQQTLPRLTIRS